MTLYAFTPAAASSSSQSQLLGTLAEHEVLQRDDAAARVRLYQKSVAARKRLTSGRKLTPSSHAKAEREVAAGQQAGEELVGSMIKLSMQIVREFAEARHGREGAAPLMDELLSEANIAVLEAASSFDPKRGPAFNTWAAQSVRNRIRSLVMDDIGSGIKVASSWNRMRRRAILERQDLADELGRQPSMEELQSRLEAVCMDWAYEHLTAAQKALPPKKRQEAARSKLRKQGMLSALNRLDEVLNSGSPVSHLDAPVGDSGATLGSLVMEDPEAPSAHDHVSAKELRELVTNVLAPLAERERSIILHRFGFIDGEVWTYKAIGELFDVSAERIRQIEEKVRTQLRDDPKLGPVLWAQLHPDEAESA